MWVCLVASALAAEPWGAPVWLPSGEDEHAWTQALHNADLLPVSTAHQADIWIKGGTATWLLLVRRDGDEVRVEISAPRNTYDRQNVAWLARSILDEGRSALPGPGDPRQWLDIASLPPPPDRSDPGVAVSGWKAAAVEVKTESTDEERSEPVAQERTSRRDRRR